MKSTIKVLLLFISLYYAQNSLGQDTSIKGRITTSEGIPIQFATVSYLGQDVGTYTDTLGNFSIKKLDFDSLLVSHIGFERKTIAIKDLKLNGIALETRIQTIAEITVHRGKADKRKWKKVSYENGMKGTDKSSPMWYGRMNSLYFSNVNMSGSIESISFFVTRSCPTNNQLRIRFLTVDPITQRPGIDFVHEEIVASNIKQNSWVRMNLKDYKIVLPSNEFFVVLESLSDGNDCFNSKSKKDSLGSYNLSIACVETKAIFYWKSFDGKWIDDSERIGDKVKARKLEMDTYSKLKNEVLASKKDKKMKEGISNSLDQGLKMKLDYIDEKWNYAPYIKIEIKIPQ
jgi:hypothetical protein